MKKILSLIVGTVFLLLPSLNAAGSAEEGGGKLSLKFAHHLPETHSVGVAYQFFADRVKEYSDGQIEVIVYAGGTLGGTKQAIEQVQAGTIHFGHGGAAFFENFTEEYAVFSLPYLFEGREHFLAAVHGEFGERFANSIPSKIGLKAVMTVYSGSRSFYTNKPVRNLADLQGLKIRVQPSRVSIDVVNTLGAAATPMSHGEVFSALQQGVIDGAENNPPTFVSAKHYEVAKYYSFDQHQMMPDYVVTNYEFWQNLQPEQQEIISRAAKEAEAYQLQLWDEVRAESIATAQASGVTFIQLDKTPFQERLAGMLEAAKRDTVLAPLVQLVEKAKGEV